MGRKRRSRHVYGPANGQKATQNQPSLRADAGAPDARLDGWINFLTKMGDENRDKRLASYFGQPRTLNTYPELEALFHGNDLANRICTLPAVEMTREWFELKIDAPDGEEAQKTADERAALSQDIQQQLQTLGAQSKITEALTWARLFGGSIVYIGADTGPADDPELPLDPTSVQAVRFLTVMDRHEVRIVEWDGDPLSPTYGDPLFYEVITSTTRKGTPLRFGSKIHASRVLHFDGTKTTRRRKRMFNTGWADSIFVKLYDVMRGYGHTWESVETLMADFAQAVIKIKGLAEMMATHGEDKVKARLDLMDTSRSVLRALMLDADFEDYERKPTPLTGLPDLIDRWLYRVASAAGVPITLLFGMSPGGLNATGESDTRFFYDMICTQQEEMLRPQLEKLLRIMLSAAQGPTKGKEPDSWSFDFVPLWQMSDKEKAELRRTQADTDSKYFDMAVLTQDEIAASRFGGDDYSLETSLDLEARNTMKRTYEEQPAVDPVTGMPATPEPGLSTPVAPASPSAGVSGAVDVQKTVLNGAQIAGMLEILKAVANEEIPRESGVAALVVAEIAADEAEAEKLMGSIGKGFVAKKPEPPPMGFPPKAGGPPPPPDKEA